MELTFRRLDDDTLRVLRAWFADPELTSRISYPTDQWFAFVTETPGVFAWMIFEKGTPIGMSQVDLAPEGGAYFDFAVNPALRGQGYGRRILRALPSQPELSTVTTLLGYVEPDNMASQSALRAAGYQRTSDALDADGMIEFVYRP